MSNPRIIVLMLNYNGKNLLEDAVSSYLANDYDNFEVVVIDNGSSDGSVDYLKANFPSVKIIRSEINLGYSGGFNIGMKYAFEEQKADFSLITNNDVKVDEHIISELVRVAITETCIGFVIGKVYHFDKPTVLQTVGREIHPVYWSGSSMGSNEIDLGQYDQIAERAFCDDIFWLVKREMYEITGGYDLNFFLQAEDFEWQARAKKNGFKIYYTPYAKLWHKASMTIGKNSGIKAYYDARNRMLVIMMHQTPEFFKRYFHEYFPRLVKNILKNIFSFKLDIAINQCRGLISGLYWGVRNHQLTWRHFI